MIRESYMTLAWNKLVALSTFLDSRKKEKYSSKMEKHAIFILKQNA